MVKTSIFCLCLVAALFEVFELGFSMGRHAGIDDAKQIVKAELERALKDKREVKSESTFVPGYRVEPAPRPPIIDKSGTRVAVRSEPPGPMPIRVAGHAWELEEFNESCDGPEYKWVLYRDSE